MITQDIAANSGGEATLVFEPPLEIVPADNAAVAVRDVAFTMAFKGAVREYSVAPPLLFDYEVDFEEAS